MKLGFLASGAGTTFQAILGACQSGAIPARPALLISNNRKAGALERARRAGVPTAVLNATRLPDPQALDAAIRDALKAAGAEWVALAGYMKKVGPKVLAAYPGRILNIHPALLPKFGGRGMYGRRVHEAVLAAGETETGATVHIADDRYDEGPILAQAKVPVHPEDTPETLQQRVQALERRLYPETIGKLARGEIALPKTQTHSDEIH